MEGPFVEVDCPHCEEPLVVTIPVDAQLVDVLKDPPDRAAETRDREVVMKTRRGRCPNDHVYGFVWIRRLHYWRVEREE
jgi:hypothetical protein